MLRTHAASLQEPTRTTAAHMWRMMLCACLFLAFATSAHAQQSPPTMAQLDTWRADGKLREVHAALDDMLKRNPQDEEAMWRLSRSYVDIGYQTKSPQERKAFYEKGMEAAKRAIALDPKSSDAELALAIAVGRLALESSTREKVELSRDVKEHVDRALALDPKNATAYHVRGRWNYGIADLGFFSKAIVKLVYGGLPDASFEQAAKDFEHATQLEDRVVDYLELGRTYMRLGRNDDAKQMFKRALVTKNHDAADREYKEEARDLLQKVN